MANHDGKNSPLLATQPLGTKSKARSYQVEMLQQSLERNVIVAMPTGSGKTLIAVMRILAALECREDGLVWFCCPGVELALQQFRQISAQIPAYQSRMLSGSDNCEYWSCQTWLEALQGISIVVSTHAVRITQPPLMSIVSTSQILLDALKHAFVYMRDISLLVLDEGLNLFRDVATATEAHHAVKSHPCSKIMTQFYHSLPPSQRPDILGLTASPSDQIDHLEELEHTLDAITRTPRIHQDELDQHVTRPQILQVFYEAYDGEQVLSESLQSLQQVLHSMDINDDPWIVKLRSNVLTRDSPQLQKALLNGSTYCMNHIKTLRHRAQSVAESLGQLAGAIYIGECIERFLAANDEVKLILDVMEDEEQRYLENLLRKVSLPGPEELSRSENWSLSPKLLALIEFLGSEDRANVAGLIFCRTRAEVAILSRILSLHPKTRKFATGTFVGASSFSGRHHRLCDLADAQEQKTNLSDLRDGRKNLIVSTEALEEGIDVVSCNLVICFEIPRTLKAFVQRRGRARDRTSKYVLLLEHCMDRDQSAKWQNIESLLESVYSDEARELEKPDKIEENDDRQLHIASTGARIDSADAVSHLDHFTSILTNDPFFDPTPTYIYEHHLIGAPSHRSLVSAKVRLPNIVEESLRETVGKHVWQSEKAARRDAAFECYCKLYNAGLLNEHLLPALPTDPALDAALQEVEVRPSVVKVAPEIDMWPWITQAGILLSRLHVSKLSLSAKNTEKVEILCLTPVPIPAVDCFEIFWDPSTTFRVELERCVKTCSVALLPLAVQTTKLILGTIFNHRILDQCHSMTPLLVPTLDASELLAWTEQVSGSVNACEVNYNMVQHDYSIVRDTRMKEVPYVFRDVKYVTTQDLTCEKEMDDKGQVQLSLRKHFKDLDLQDQQTYVVLEVTRFSKRRNFFHKKDVPLNMPSAEWLPAELCTFDRMPFRLCQLAKIVPSLLHNMHIAFVMQEIQSTLLKPLAFACDGLLKPAIFSPSAQEPSNYQRLEFLGDCVLKLLTTVNLTANHLNYPEAILAKTKDHIVSNARLARVALRTGLDRFIITKSFAASRWRIPTGSVNPASEGSQGRELSTKVLADVVEAIIGASFLDGGYAKAVACLRIFLPEETWNAPESIFDSLHDVYQQRPQERRFIADVQRLLGYSFTVPAFLIESVTHASCQIPGMAAPYERLEFLGDAVLDSIVTTAAFDREPPISVPRLHLIRSVLVNADLLGYLCFQHKIWKEKVVLNTEDPHNIKTMSDEAPLYLWQVLRHASPTIMHAQQACLTRLHRLGEGIHFALGNGTQHPWSMLAQLEPPKPYSDIVESLLGAIYIDSRGDLTKCSNFLDKIGFTSYLRRLLSSDVALLHPKQELGQLSDQADVQYKMSKAVEADEQRLVCSIIVGDRTIATVTDGERLHETQTRAAEIACNVLKHEKGCDDKSMDVNSEGFFEADRDSDEMDQSDRSSEDQYAEMSDEIMSNEDSGLIGDNDSDQYMTADE